VVAVLKAVIVGERQAEVREALEPRAREDWAIVKVHVAPMCTEYKAWLAGSASQHLGHEAVGEVVEVAQPCKVRVGDRVVVMPQYPCGTCELCVAGDYIHCRHCVDPATFLGVGEGWATQAQYLAKPSWLLPRIPDDLSYEMAGLALCALGPSFAAFERMAVDGFDTVLITGAGPVGLGGVVNAVFRGARVLVVEGVPYRQDLARTLGASEVLDPADESALARIRDLTGGRGVDKTLDCSGVPAAHRLCIDAARRRGHVAFVGECSDDTILHVSPDMIRKGLTLHGAWHYNLSLYPRIMDVIRRSPVVGKLITHTFPISRVQDAMQVSASHQCGKVLLHPWE
jgi:L-iditol 2-dehydrogenase